MLGLINDILELSKIETGWIEIPEIVRSVLTLVKERARKHGIGLELDLADDLPAPVRSSLYPFSSEA